MSNYFSAKLVYERRGATVVPVLFTSLPQPGGGLKCIRATELSFPLIDTRPYWADVPEMAYNGDIVTTLLTTRVRSDVSGTVQPILQTKHDAPIDADCLCLDDQALAVHERDTALGNGQCDNPWVASLYEPETDDDYEELGGES